MEETKRSGPGSKSRSGCVTCKARRVKCDETKPACIRCQNFRLECGGYKVKQRPTHSTQRLLPLVPKIEPMSTAVTPLALTPAQTLSTNDRELSYFKVFVGTTSRNLGEYLDTPLWCHIVLQASEQDQFIKHAIIALGALNKSHDVTAAIGNLSGRTLVAGSAHHQVAFRHYGKSIQGIRKACQEQRKSRRTILIACLLAVCFEYYHGNLDLAIAHVQNGSRLIDEWFLSLMHLTSFDGQQFLQGIIEDELISIFTRLDRDIYSWHKAHLVEMHPDLQNVAGAIIQAIPTQGFTDLNAARKFFDILLTQVDRFVYNIDERLWDYSDPSSEPGPVLQVGNPTGAIVPPIYQQQRLDFLKQGLTSWRKAFQPVLTRSLKLGGKDLLVAKTLVLNFICSAVALHCCVGLELTYDAYVSEFRTALSTAGTLFDVAASKLGHTFVVSSILIKSLFFIASKCREASIRTEAINYLRSMSRQEGIWDSQVTSIFATAIVELEESDESGLIPEHRRLRAIKITFDLHKRQGKLRFLTATMDTGPVGFVAHRMELCW